MPRRCRWEIVLSSAGSCESHWLVLKYIWPKWHLLSRVLWVLYRFRYTTRCSIDNWGRTQNKLNMYPLWNAHCDSLSRPTILAVSLHEPWRPMSEYVPCRGGTIFTVRYIYFQSLKDSCTTCSQNTTIQWLLRWWSVWRDRWFEINIRDPHNGKRECFS